MDRSTLVHPQQGPYSWFLRNILLPLGDTFTGQHMIRRLKHLEEMQWWTPDRIAERRNELLLKTLTAAGEAPFYRDLFHQCGITIGKQITPEVLTQLPVITKDMLRANYPHRTVRDTGQKTYEACTSGSTGKNFCVKEDAATAGWYRATTLLFFEWAGWHLGEAQLQTGMTLSRSFDRRLKDFFLRCFYISAYDLSDRVLENSLRLLEQKRIAHLWGYPGSLYFLARYALRMGWNRTLKTVVTWGDNLYSHYRETIEQAFKTQVIDSYGCGEGMQIAAQCGAGSHYHVHDLDVIVEYLNENGEPAPAGCPGQVVITRLHAGPMPLIRYRIGDIAAAAPGFCSCGRGFSLMQGIQGRETDVIVTPAGNRLIVHFFTGIMEYFSEIDQFQVVQEYPGSIHISVTERSAIDDNVKSRIIRALRQRGADSLKIEIEVVPDIPLPPSGKRRFVISKVKTV
jgi:phenylacetate-CoA ligase